MISFHIPLIKNNYNWIKYLNNNGKYINYEEEAIEKDITTQYRIFETESKKVKIKEKFDESKYIKVQYFSIYQKNLPIDRRYLQHI